jgi:molybdopterin molybdotransferase
MTPPYARTSAASWARARELAHAAVSPLPPRTVELADATGHALAADLLALTSLPPFDTAAMDGYAVSGTGPWVVCGQVNAGDAPPTALDPGTAVEISTGAPVPSGAAAILPVEEVTRTGELVVGPQPEPRAHIRTAGEDARHGELLAVAGATIGPALLGLAAAAGHDRLLVGQCPRVTVLITGDELLHSGISGGGQIRDALGPMLPPLIEGFGGHVAGLAFVPDQPADRLATELSRVGPGEVGIVTGSTSVGRTDRLRWVLCETGARWVVDTVACRPGHPQLLAATATGSWVAGLPGNPFAALVAAHTLVEPLLGGLSGRPLAPLPRLPLHGSAGRLTQGQTRVVPVVWADDGLRALDRHQSAFLRAAAQADGLAAVPDDWKDGQSVPVLLSC